MVELFAALVRHGDYRQPAGVPSAHLPHPLTANGIDVARGEAQRLHALARRRGWTIERHLDCSRLLRAWQTAAIFAEELTALSGRRFLLQEYDALAERGLGAAANLSVDEIAAAVRADPRYGPLPGDWKSRADLRLPFLGAESLSQAGRRVARHLKRRMAALRKRAQADTVKLFVGHGAAFRHGAVALGALPGARVAAVSMHHCRPVVLSAPGEGAWRKVAGQWKPRRGARGSELDVA